MGSDSLSIFTDGQKVLDLFPFGFTRNLLFKKREPFLASTPMGDPGWRRLLSICIPPLLFQGEVNLDSPEEILAVTGGVSGSIVI